MPKKAATPKKKTGSTKKEGEKKSLHQEFADIIAGVDVDGKKPERKKKEVDRFDLEVLSLVPKATRETVFEDGSGEKLKDLSALARNVRDHDGDDAIIKKLHQLLYGRPGKAHETKKNILRYSGLAGKSKKEGKEKFQTKLASWRLNDIRAVAKMFLLESGGTKEELIDSLVEFLSSPKAPKVVPKKKSKKTITKKKPLAGKKKRPSKKSATSESEVESASEAESSAPESASEKEDEKPRGRKRKASPSPKRGKKSASPSPRKKKAASKSRSRSRSPARSKTPTKKSSTPKKAGAGKKKGASPSPKKKAASRSRSRSRSPARTPTKKKGASPSPKKKAASPAKKGSTAKKPAAKKRKTK